MSDDEIQEILNLHHHLQIFKQCEGSLRRIKETFKLWVNCFLWVQGHLFVYVYYCLSSVLRIVPDKLCIHADPGMNTQCVCTYKHSCTQCESTCCQFTRKFPLTCSSVQFLLLLTSVSSYFLYFTTKLCKVYKTNSLALLTISTWRLEIWLSG